MTRPDTAVDDLPLVVFNHGPWAGWWLDRTRLEINQAAARAMRRDPDTDPAGVVLRYQPTDRQRDNPVGHGPGQVYRWAS